MRDYIPVLNQVDNDNLKECQEIAECLLEAGIKKVIIADTSQDRPIREVVVE